MYQDSCNQALAQIAMAALVGPPACRFMTLVLGPLVPIGHAVIDPWYLNWGYLNWMRTRRLA